MGILDALFGQKKKGIDKAEALARLDSLMEEMAVLEQKLTEQGRHVPERKEIPFGVLPSVSAREFDEEAFLAAEEQLKEQIRQMRRELGE